MAWTSPNVIRIIDILLIFIVCLACTYSSQMKVTSMFVFSL